MKKTFDPVRIKQAMQLLFQADRWRGFLHSRMWAGLPAAAATTFCILYPLQRLGEGFAGPDALAKTAFYTAMVAGCWMLGIWIATASAEDGAKRRPEEAEETTSEKARWWSRLWAIVLIATALGFICHRQIEGMATGAITLSRGCTGILLKLLSGAAVIIPVRLTQRRG